MLNDIKRRRLELGLKQSELEKLTGISQPKISQYERGLPLTPEDSAKLGRVLGIQSQGERATGSAE